MNISSSPKLPEKLTAPTPQMTTLRVAALGAVAVAAWHIQNSHRKHGREEQEAKHRGGLQKADQFIPQGTPYIPPFVPGPDPVYGYAPSPVFVPPPIYFDPYPGFYGYY